MIPADHRGTLEAPAVPDPPGVPASTSADSVTRSAAGAYLRATATNRAAAVHLRPDVAAWTVFSCAFEAAVRLRFPVGCPLPEITRSVAGATRRHAPVAVPPLEAEMLIRDVLGEAVPIAEIPPATVVASHLLTFASLVDELALTDAEIDDLVSAAEGRARELGGARTGKGRP